MRKVKNLIWIGEITGVPDLKIALYTNPKFTVYRAWIFTMDYDLKENIYKGTFTEIKTKSWKRLMHELQKILVSYENLDSKKALWVDRWLWDNKPLHEYVLSY